MKPFKFKQFTVHQDKAAMKVGTDAVLLGAWAHVKDDVASILDIGSGTGVIALMLAQRTKATTIDAVEVNNEAYEQTVENFENSKWADRLFCYHASFQEFSKALVEDNETYDFIISNPPFYAEDYQTSSKSRNMARFTNSLSFKALLLGVKSILAKNGVFAVVLPSREKKNFIGIAKEHDLFAHRICDVKGATNAKVNRVLIEFSFGIKKTHKENITLEKERHQYTDSYREMVKDFYLKL